VAWLQRWRAVPMWLFADRGHHARDGGGLSGAAQRGMRGGSWVAPKAMLAAVIGPAIEALARGCGGAQQDRVAARRSVKDLTDGSIAKNIVQMRCRSPAGMFFQTLYFSSSICTFVRGIGPRGDRGVGAAGNVMFIVFALTQVLGVARWR